MSVYDVHSTDGSIAVSDLSLDQVDALLGRVVDELLKDVVGLLKLMQDFNGDEPTKPLVYTGTHVDLFIEEMGA